MMDPKSPFFLLYYYLFILLRDVFLDIIGIGNPIWAQIIRRIYFMCSACCMCIYDTCRGNKLLGFFHSLSFLEVNC